MATRTQPLVTAALRSVELSAEEVMQFAGKRPAHASYRLEPVADQDWQYELAMAFDSDDDQDDGDAVNPFYGIPFGVSMLMARDALGEPAGFITFRHELRETAPGPDKAWRAQYDFKIFVFMVREDLRRQGYGSALAVSCLSTIREDLRAISGCCTDTAKPAVSVRFVGEGKSDGGVMLLEAVARNLGIVSGEVHRDWGLPVAEVAAEIL